MCVKGRLPKKRMVVNRAISSFPKNKATKKKKNVSIKKIDRFTVSIQYIYKKRNV